MQQKITAHEDEPDHRFTLANERTFLAWVRTALALLAAAVALVQLVPEFGIPGGRQVLGVLLASLAVLAAVAGVVRWERVQRAMRRSQPLPITRIPWILAVGMAIIAGATLLLLAFADG